MKPLSSMVIEKKILVLNCLLNYFENKKSKMAKKYFQ